MPVFAENPSGHPVNPKIQALASCFGVSLFMCYQPAQPAVLMADFRRGYEAVINCYHAEDECLTAFCYELLRAFDWRPDLLVPRSDLSAQVNMGYVEQFHEIFRELLPAWSYRAN